ncbi:MAG TPA: ABC transporter permease, partial [Ilumatobacteraceae bacterium]
MTAVVADPAVVEPARIDFGQRIDRLRGAARIVVAFVGSLLVFAILILIKGVNPWTAYTDMISSTFGSWDSIGDILVRSTPIILAALAVSVPARAGLINVGGEGQLLMGGIGGMGMSLALGSSLPGPLTLVLMVVAAALAGAAWAGLAAALRQFVGISESVTTLLLNYVALDLMYFLIYDRWKDRHGSGQPATRPLPSGERLPILFGRVHAGILLALGAAVIIGLVFALTSWGFRLRVVGGNAEAARRSGLRVGALLISAMAVGGALAGIGGLTQLAGAEFKLREGFIAGYGYIGFLASWLGRHRPGYVVVSAILLSSIVIGGDSLQIDSKLPAASVNVLLAVTLLAVFGFGR